MSSANYFKLGLFVIGASALVIIGVIVLGAGTVFRQYIPLETYVDESVQGLEIGSPIKHRGIQIGSVDYISFVRNEYPLDPRLPEFDEIGKYVLIRVKLYPEVFPEQLRKDDVDGDNVSDVVKQQLGRLVDRGLRISLAYQGVTGVAYLEADYVRDPERFPVPKISWEPKSYYLPSRKSAFGSIFESARQVLGDLEDAHLEEIGGKLQTLLVTLERQIGNIKFEDLRDEGRAFLAELRTTNRQVQTILEDPAVDELLHNASKSSEIVRGLLQRSEDRLESMIVDLATITSNLGAASAKLPELLAHLNRNLRHLDRLVANNAPEIEELVDNLSTASRDLKALIANAKKYPSQLLFGEPPPERNAAPEPKSEGSP